MKSIKISTHESFHSEICQRYQVDDISIESEKTSQLKSLPCQQRLDKIKASWLKITLKIPLNKL